MPSTGESLVVTAIAHSMRDRRNPPKDARDQRQ
jgi:hypothetical protein